MADPAAPTPAPVVEKPQPAVEPATASPAPSEAPVAQETKQPEMFPKDKAKALAAKEQGNKLFVAKDYFKAMDSYSEALLLAPDDAKDDKAMMYSNRAACHLMLEQWEDVVADTSKAIELKTAYNNALQRRGQAYEKLDKPVEAFEDYKEILKTDPTHEKANQGVARLKDRVAAMQEKQKAEMLGKLKELGNGLLGKFGMSLDNFKAIQDPKTGSYNISFQR